MYLLHFQVQLVVQVQQAAQVPQVLLGHKVAKESGEMQVQRVRLVQPVLLEVKEVKAGQVQPEGQVLPVLMAALEQPVPLAHRDLKEMLEVRDRREREGSQVMQALRGELELQGPQGLLEILAQRDKRESEVKRDRLVQMELQALLELLVELDKQGRQELQGRLEVMVKLEQRGHQDLLVQQVGPTNDTLPHTVINSIATELNVF